MYGIPDLHSKLLNKFLINLASLGFSAVFDIFKDKCTVESNIWHKGSSCRGGDRGGGLAGRHVSPAALRMG